MPTRLEVSYNKRVPIPGVKYAFEEYTAQVSVDYESSDPSAPSYQSLLTEVRDAVDAQFQRDAADGLGLVELVPETENDAPQWARQGPDPEASTWARKWSHPEHDEAASRDQIAYIENLYFDKIIPHNDSQAMNFYKTIEMGNLGKTEAKACIEYLKTFCWKPTKEQRGAAFKKG